MTIAETYLVLFAAIEAADTLFVIWLVGTVAVNGAVYYLADNIAARVNSLLFFLYCLFAFFLLGRWTIIVAQILGFLDGLRAQGESLPPQGVSAALGIAVLLFIVVFTAATIRYIWPRRRKVRVV